MTALDIQAVAARRVPMRNQDTFIGLADANVCLDQIAAAADVRRDLRREVTHSGMEHVTLARAVNAVSVHHEALAKTIVERQHVMLCSLVPPKLDQCSELLGL